MTSILLQAVQISSRTIRGAAARGQTCFERLGHFERPVSRPSPSGRGSSALRSSQPSQIEAAGQLPEKTIFGPLHFATLPRAPVIEAAQVEDAVDDIADQFGLPGGAEAAGLRCGLIHANDDVSVQRGGGIGRATRQRAAGRPRLLAVIEAEDIGGAGMMQECLVQAGHLGRANQQKAEVKIIQSHQAAQERRCNPARQGQIEAAGSLPAAQGEVRISSLHSFWPWERAWPRCSS